MRRTKSRSPRSARTLGRDVERELLVLVLDAAAHLGADLAEQGRQLELRHVRHERAVLAAADVEQVHHHAHHRLRGAQDVAQRVAIVAGQHAPPEHVLGVREDARERVLEVVDDERRQLLLLRWAARSASRCERITS